MGKSAGVQNKTEITSFYYLSSSLDNYDTCFKVKEFSSPSFNTIYIHNRKSYNHKNLDMEFSFVLMKICYLKLFHRAIVWTYLTFLILKKCPPFQTKRQIEFVLLYFLKKERPSRYTYLIIGRDKSYFVKHHWIKQSNLWNWQYQDASFIGW